MTTSPSRFASAVDLLDDWRDDLVSGEPPTRYVVGDGDLARIEVGPGLVTLLGGAPGAGKTALVMQFVVEALSRTPDLRAIVCNVEMRPQALLDRQLARLSGVDLGTIRGRKLGPEHADALDAGMTALGSVADRLAFVKPPFDLGNTLASAEDFGAGFVVLDYVQRIKPPGRHSDLRTAVGSTMGVIREVADAGVAVLVVAALARGRDDRGRSNYTDGLSLASFRESSELEYGCDDAFILTPDDPDSSSSRLLMHPKSRNGECRDVHLGFDGARQRFTPTTAPPKPPTPTKGGVDRAVKLKIHNAWSK